MSYIGVAGFRERSKLLIKLVSGVTNKVSCAPIATSTSIEFEGVGIELKLTAEVIPEYCKVEGLEVGSRTCPAV